jgi:hypothetical protein
VKVLQQSRAGNNESGAQKKRAYDSPEENPVLKHGRSREILKNHEKDEEIVDAERFLNYVSGEKFKRLLLSPREIDREIEDERQENPHRAPS